MTDKKQKMEDKKIKQELNKILPPNKLIELARKKQKLTKQERKNLALKEYKKIEETGWKEYEKNKEPFYREYEKIRDSGWKEYEKKCEEIDSEPEEPKKIKIKDGHKYKLVEKVK